MRLEDREDYVDLIAQAVIDRIEERDRINGLVDMVVKRVLDSQREQMESLRKAQMTSDVSSNATEEGHEVLVSNSNGLPSQRK